MNEVIEPKPRKELLPAGRFEHFTPEQLAAHLKYVEQHKAETPF